MLRSKTKCITAPMQKTIMIKIVRKTREGSMVEGEASDTWQSVIPATRQEGRHA